MTFALPPVLTGAAFAAYVVLAAGLHWVAGAAYVWEVAALMMVLMTVTYPVEAFLTKQHRGLEATIALGLSVVAVLGLVLHPALIIAAIFAHGLLDLAKHSGLGVPFYRAYLFGCAAFDVAYAALLLSYALLLGGF